MSDPIEQAGERVEVDFASGLSRLAELPGWLRAALQADKVLEALHQHVPEFSSGMLELRGCKIKRLFLKDMSGRWEGTYQLTYAQPPSSPERTDDLHGILTAPQLYHPAAAPLQEFPFGTPGWHCSLPELNLSLEMEPPESVLPAMPQLTDPEQARLLLEASLRLHSPAGQNVRILACTPKILSYKPGSRLTVRYELEYPAQQAAGRTWPETVIAKTYRRASKGQNAYDGMLALWRSPLSGGETVLLAEPLAYLPELKVLFQGPVPGEQSLEDLLKEALSSQAPEAIAGVERWMRRAGAGLAALHRSGVQLGETVTWEGRAPEIRELTGRLLLAAPEFTDVATPVLARLEAYAAAYPADSSVPTHGTFNPEQVLIDQEQIAFIDFDDFCQAEPAMDVGLFRAAIKDTGLNALDRDQSGNREARLERLALLDQFGEAFLAQYEALAPVSRARVALWEALDYLRSSLHYWIKVKPAEPDHALFTLQQHLQAMRLVS